MNFKNFVLIVPLRGVACKCDIFELVVTPEMLSMVKAGEPDELASLYDGYFDVGVRNGRLEIESKDKKTSESVEIKDIEDFVESMDDLGFRHLSFFKIPDARYTGSDEPNRAVFYAKRAFSLIEENAGKGKPLGLESWNDADLTFFREVFESCQDSASAAFLSEEFGDYLKNLKSEVCSKTNAHGDVLAGAVLCQRILSGGLPEQFLAELNEASGFSSLMHRQGVSQSVKPASLPKLS